MQPSRSRHGMATRWWRELSPESAGVGPNQKDLSLEDQDDHGRAIMREHYDGHVNYRLISTKGKGEWLDRPELAQIETMLRTLLQALTDLEAEEVTLGRQCRVHSARGPRSVGDSARSPGAAPLAVASAEAGHF